MCNLFPIVDRGEIVSINVDEIGDNIFINRFFSLNDINIPSGQVSLYELFIASHSLIK